MQNTENINEAACAPSRAGEAGANLTVGLGEIILENSNGVQIREGRKTSGHYLALYADCHCGEYLYVAPTIFQADHKKGDPVLVCADHGVHAFRFLELTKGKQASPNVEVRGRPLLGDPS